MAKAPKKEVFKTSLADSGSRTIVIVAVVAGLVALGIVWAIISISSPDQNKSQASRVPTNLDSTTSGTEDAEMTKLLTEQDRQRAEQASNSGESMIATLTALSQTDQQTIPEPRIPEPTRPDSNQPKAPTAPEPAKNVQPKAQAQTVQRQDRSAQDEVDSRLTNEIQNIMSAMSLHGGAAQVYKTSNDSDGSVDDRADRRDSDPVDTAERVAENKTTTLPLIPAAEVLYAVLETKADSDVPGPVTARVLSGDFRGSHLIGSFVREDDRIRLKLQKMVLPDHGSVSVDAIAVNPNDSSIGLATYVNRHYVKRFGGLILGGFVEGFGQAVAQSGQTSSVSPFGSVTTTNDGYDTGEQLAIAAGSGAAAAGGELKELADTPTTVRVAANTPIGVLFLSDVAHPASN